MTEFISKFDGWMKAELGEPTFTLLARDFRAANHVRQWAYERERDIHMGRKPAADTEMVREARRIALAMEEWYLEHRGETPLNTAQKLRFGTTTTGN
jgi:hypothetical protein